MSGLMESRRPLAAALIAGLVATASPVPLFADTVGVASDGPRGFLVAVDGVPYHLDLDDARRNAAAFAAGEGAYEVVLRRNDTGREVFAFGAERSAGRLELVYRAGRDRLTLIFPETMLRAAAGGPVEGRGRMVVDVNGAVASLDGGWFDRFHGHGLSGRVFEEEQLPQELKQTFEALVDPAGFVEAWSTYGRVVERTSEPHTLVDDALDAAPRCLAPCSSCVRSAAMMGLSWLAIVAACGPTTVASAGMGFALCVASLVAHGTIVGVAATSCSICLDCVGNPPEPPDPPDDPDEPGDDDPTCPPGSHPCCQGQCCIDFEAENCP